MYQTKTWLGIITSILVILFGIFPHPVQSRDEIYRISFEMRVNDNIQLYSVNSDGTDLKSLTNVDGTSGGMWSPDGTKLAFLQKIAQATHIFVVDQASGLAQTITPFTPNQTQNSEPHWSPDSKRIVFGSNKTSDNEMYVINADGTSEIRLTNVLGYDHAPRWSPDGNQIAFVSDRSGTQQVYIMNQDGSNQTQLTHSKRNNTFPVWSIDGNTIFFGSDRDGNLEIYAIGINGEGEKNITNNPSYDLGVVWSPDGSKFAFISDRDGSFQVYIADNDGTNPTRLVTILPNMDSPAWSPDGTELAVTVGNLGTSEIYIISVDGQKVRKLLNTDEPIGFMMSPQWQPKRSN